MIERILKKLKNKVDSAEVFSSNITRTKMDVTNGKILNSNKVFFQGTGIRVINNGRIGFVYSCGSEKESRLIRAVIKNARLSKPVKNATFAFPKKYSVNGIIDKRIVELRAEQLADLIKDAIAGAKTKSIIPNVVYTTASVEKTTIANTNGVFVENKFTSIYSSIEVEHKGVSAWNTEASRFLDINFFDFGKRVAELIKKSIAPRKFKTCVCPVILNYRAINDLFLSITIPQLTATNVQQNRTPYIKLNQKIASDKITIVDNGTFEKGLFSARSDGEGTAMQETTLVKKGFLKAHMYDTLRAAKVGKNSTANAVRWFSSVPFIWATNFVIEPGKYSLEQLIRQTKKGILVNGLIGAHMSNPVSGDFSVETENVFYIENGEIKYPLKDIMLSGNLPQLLKKVDMVANNTKQASEVVAPSIRISEMQIISG